MKSCGEAMMATKYSNNKLFRKPITMTNSLDF